MMAAAVAAAETSQASPRGARQALRGVPFEADPVLAREILWAVSIVIWICV